MKSLMMATLIFSAAVSFAASRPETANNASQRLQATVPFDFRVGNVVLPAGTYVFTFDAVRQAGWIESTERRAKIYTLSSFVKAGTDSRLEFKREGKLMVLQQAPENRNARELDSRAGMAQLQSYGPAPAR